MKLIDHSEKNKGEQRVIKYLVDDGEKTTTTIIHITDSEKSAKDIWDSVVSE